MQTSLPWRDIMGLLYMGYWLLQEFYIKHHMCNARPARHPAGGSGPGFLVSKYNLIHYDLFGLEIDKLIYCQRHVIYLVLFFLSLVLIHCDSRGDEKENKDTVALIRIDKSAIRPDDGDTFFYKDFTIRILGIDAPEIIHKEHGIFENQPYGRKAAEMTIDILRKAKIVEYIPFQNDKYGRLLAHVFVNGKLLSVHLIKAGLAYETVSHYGDNGFPELAQRILKAAHESPSPPFEKPYKWRRRHQIRKWK